MSQESEINLKIIGPDNKLINEVTEAFYFYEFIATLAGEYQFILTNSKSEIDIRVSFAIHQGKDTNTHLTHENLNSIWDKLLDITNKMKKSSFTSKMLSKKFDAKYDIIKIHNRNIVLFSLIEIALMIIIFFLQVFYIKKLAKNNMYNI
jgi:hypothetical protein